MRYAILFLVVLAIPALAHAATLKVPSQYPAIQAAIDAANVGDTVLVAPGTYTENIDFKGKAITVLSSSGAEVTTIDGNQTGSVVAFKSGEGLDAVLENFTLTNGSNNDGGGIYCLFSSPTISGNIIQGNVAKGSGSG